MKDFKFGRNILMIFEHIKACFRFVVCKTDKLRLRLLKCEETKENSEMEIPFKKVLWNDHEAALLVEVYYLVKNGNLTRDKALQQLSERLRNKLLSDGIPINEKYRNIAGIDLQLNSIERFVSNGNDGFGANATTSRVFENMLKLKNDDESAFDKILNEANNLYPKTTKKSIYTRHQDRNGEDEFKDLSLGGYPKIRVDVISRWNKYEAVLLVNLYLQINSGTLHRNESCKLIQARFEYSSCGAKRNIRLSSMELSSILSEIEQYDKGRSTSIDLEIARALEIWRNNKSDFNNLLSSALELYPLEKKIKSTDSIPKKDDDIKTKKVFIKNQTDGWSFYGRNKEQEIIHEINEKPVKKSMNVNLNEVFVEHFSNGYRLDSKIDRKRFSIFYSSKYKQELSIKDKDLDEEIKLCGLVYNNRVYAPEGILSEEIRKEIFCYINDQFNNNFNCVYYDVLFEVFNVRLLNSRVLNSDMLKFYLQYFDTEDEYYYQTEYLTKDPNYIPDISYDVLAYVKEMGVMVSEDEILLGLSFYPNNKVKEVFSGNKDILLSAGRKVRFHIDNFQLEQSDKDFIVEYLKKQIASYGFVSFSELLEKMRKFSPRVIENNVQFSETGIRSALVCKLSDQFNFRGGIISDVSNPISMQDAFIEFSRGREFFSMDEVQTMADDFGTVINFEALAENNIRVSQDLYVNKNNINFDIEQTDEAIDRFCTSDYISISEVHTFTAFPENTYKWSEFILESYLYLYSKDFMLMHNRFNKSSVSGAIVRKSSEIKDYNDVLAKVLVDNKISLEKQDDILNLLFEKGFIARRQLDSIEEVINRARKIIYK